jgi:hypothetical protein
MSKAKEFAKTCAEALGFQGRLLLFAGGVLGLLFPGMVGYVILSGVAKGLKDADIRKMIEELEESA